MYDFPECKTVLTLGLYLTGRVSKVNGGVQIEANPFDTVVCLCAECP